MTKFNRWHIALLGLRLKIGALVLLPVCPIVLGILNFNSGTPLVTALLIAMLPVILIDFCGRILCLAFPIKSLGRLAGSILAQALGLCGLLFGTLTWTRNDLFNFNLLYWQLGVTLCAYFWMAAGQALAALLFSRFLSQVAETLDIPNLRKSSVALLGSTWLSFGLGIPSAVLASLLIYVLIAVAVIYYFTILIPALALILILLLAAIGIPVFVVIWNAWLTTIYFYVSCIRSLSGATKCYSYSPPITANVRKD